MRRVVFDTNIYISAFISPGGVADTALRKVVAGSTILFTSVPILVELSGKLSTKFQWDQAHVVEAIHLVGLMAVVVRPSRRISVLRDEPDNRILECALEAEADAVVTGDRHLLRLQEFQGIRIMSLAEFSRLE